MPQHSVRVGCRLDLSIPNYQALLDQALAAERSGFSALWLRDHFSVLEQFGSKLAFECWTSLTAVAVQTKTIKVGTQVICYGWRNPALLAKMASTLDVVSGGRLMLGIGAGNLPREWEDFGYQVPPIGERLQRVAEYVQIMRLMWTEDAPTFDGKFYNIRTAINEPKPIQKGGPPVIIGATGEKSLRNVARLADGWNALITLDDFRKKSELLTRYCEDINRDPESIEKYVVMFPMYNPNAEDARRRTARLLETMPGSGGLRRLGAVGGVDEILDHMRPFVQAGCRNFITFFVDPERSVEDILAFGQDIIPKLSQLN